MPPKPRGSGTARGRGRGRGGASAARAAATSPADGSQESGAPTAVMVPEAESKPTAADSSIASTVEGQSGDNAEASASGTSGRKPVQRLESLKSMEPISRSASPAVRRSASTKGKKATPAVVKPIAARRSKQERDQLTKSLTQREKERLAEKRAEEKQKAREKPFKRPDRPQNRAAVPIGGPFSLGSVAKEKGSKNSITTFGGRATRIKREDYNDGEGGSSSRAGGSGGGGGGDGGYISSGDDEGGNIPRKDIDAIEISDDEDEGKDRAGSEPAMLLPVRIGRREHVERAVAINTEASSEAAAKILQQAEATNGEIKAESVDLFSKKGKGKAKDLEITGSRRPYKGMWQDDEEPSVAVKAEPISDDEAMPDAEAVGNTELAEPVADGARRKSEPKIRIRNSKGKAPVLQTEEEKQEHARFNLFQDAVRFELGPDGETTAQPRSDSSYIFQLPPMIPKPAIAGEIKPDPEATPAPAETTKDGKRKKPVKEKVDPLKTTTQAAQVGEVLVGKIRVHASGRTTLLWGDMVFDLIAGNPADSLGEVIEAERIPPEQRVVPEDHGEVGSLGRVKGKFVALPSWRAML